MPETKPDPESGPGPTATEGALITHHCNTRRDDTPYTPPPPIPPPPSHPSFHPFLHFIRSFHLLPCFDLYTYFPSSALVRWIVIDQATLDLSSSTISHSDCG